MKPRRCGLLHFACNYHRLPGRQRRVITKCTEDEREETGGEPRSGGASAMAPCHFGPAGLRAGEGGGSADDEHQTTRSERRTPLGRESVPAKTNWTMAKPTKSGPEEKGRRLSG